MDLSTSEKSSEDDRSSREHEIRQLEQRLKAGDGALLWDFADPHE
jgi:hypothetical protein